MQPLPYGQPNTTRPIVTVERVKLHLQLQAIHFFFFLLQLIVLLASRIYHNHSSAYWRRCVLLAFLGALKPGGGHSSRSEITHPCASPSRSPRHLADSLSLRPQICAARAPNIPHAPASARRYPRKPHTHRFAKSLPSFRETCVDHSRPRPKQKSNTVSPPGFPYCHKYA